MKQTLSITSLAIIMVLCSGIASAQDSIPGGFKLTSSITVNDRTRQGGATKQKGSVNFSLRLNKRLTVGASNEAFSSKKPEGGERSTGVGNTTLSVKTDIVLRNNDEPVPGSLYFTYTVTLPSASVSKGLGTGRVDHKFLASGTIPVGASDVGLDLGLLISGRKDESGFLSTGLMTFNFDRPFDKEGKYKFHAEMDFASRADDIPSEIYTVSTLTYKFSPTFSLRGGIRNGITPNSARVGGIFSLIINGRLFKRD